MCKNNERKEKMQIRQAKLADVPSIMKIYEKARGFMARNGNPTQWAVGYPGQQLVEADIAEKNCYVCEKEGSVVGVFSLIIGEDPTYQKIERGAWNKDETYGTIHRLASDGQTKGIAKVCFDFCKEKCRYLRIDTHQDNKPMQAAITKYGFQKCGIIHVANGSERIAFDIWFD